eukprot:5876144-Pyramimonas_sp.AAC.1
MGPRSALLGTGDACGHRHSGLRWTFLWGREATLCWVGGTHMDTAAGACPSVKLPMEHETHCRFGGTHVGTATGRLGGAPYGAT